MCVAGCPFVGFEAGWLKEYVIEVFAAGWLGAVWLGAGWLDGTGLAGWLMF